MNEPIVFNITPENLRKLADETIGEPVPEELRRQLVGFIPEAQQEEFYRGMASGVNLLLHLLTVVDEPAVVKGCVMCVEIHIARLYCQTADDDEADSRR